MRIITVSCIIYRFSEPLDVNGEMSGNLNNEKTKSRMIIEGVVDVW